MHAPDYRLLNTLSILLVIAQHYVYKLPDKGTSGVPFTWKRLLFARLACLLRSCLNGGVYRCPHLGSIGASTGHWLCTITPSNDIKVESYLQLCKSHRNLHTYRSGTHRKWVYTVSPMWPERIRCFLVMSYTGSSTPTTMAALWAVRDTP